MRREYITFQIGLVWWLDRHTGGIMGPKALWGSIFPIRQQSVREKYRQISALALSAGYCNFDAASFVLNARNPRRCVKLDEPKVSEKDL
jgi:hypothetical protein